MLQANGLQIIIKKRSRLSDLIIKQFIPADKSWVDNPIKMDNLP